MAESDQLPRQPQGEGLGTKAMPELEQYTRLLRIEIVANNMRLRSCRLLVSISVHKSDYVFVPPSAKLTQLDEILHPPFRTFSRRAAWSIFSVTRECETQPLQCHECDEVQRKLYRCFERRLRASSPRARTIQMYFLVSDQLELIRTRAIRRIDRNVCESENRLDLCASSIRLLGTMPGRRCTCTYKVKAEFGLQQVSCKHQYLGRQNFVLQDGGDKRLNMQKSVTTLNTGAIVFRFSRANSTFSDACPRKQVKRTENLMALSLGKPQVRR